MKASKLWLGTAVIRGIESHRSPDERLFEDRLALAFLPSVWRRIIGLLRSVGLLDAVLAMRERQYPGVVGNLLCRTRYIDDVLREALKAGFDQVVLLGAGFDSRPYRIPGIDQTRVFEVDHPATQARKRARLQQILGTLPSHVAFVPIDFDRQKLKDVMPAAGFSTGARTFFLWEGVTQYISAEAVDATFEYVSRAAGNQSRIVFTYIRKGIIDGSSRSPQDEKLISLTRRIGVPWVFGIDPNDVAEYLSARGLELVEEVGTSEYKVRYLEPLRREMTVFEGERVALATGASGARQARSGTLGAK
ncbi:MAG: SAM-dependent methyltransferase [Ignavibacteria bacterium]|nr:SAM-dependent methyltransferase [Ignavibacteria bacterium]